MKTASSPVPASPAAAVFPSWWHAAIVLLAAVLRLYDLDLRPPHFDEGVNGWFTDQMQHWGCYRYDPSNYHGPLHFYALFLFKILFGRHVWALRLPVVIVGVLTVDLTLRFERFFGRRAAVWAALAMTLSPGFLYYQRDAIHETWLVYFLILGFWGIFGVWQDGAKRYLWAVGMAVTGAVLTKETYLIHFGCFVLAVPCLLVIEALNPSARTVFTRAESPPPPEDRTSPMPLFDESPLGSSPVWRSFAPQAWREKDAWVVVAVGLALILFFYSGNGLYLSQDVQVDGRTVHQFAPGVRGLFKAFEFWGKKSQEGEGHNKPFLYWTRLLMNNEPFALLGMLASFFYAVPPLLTRQHWARWPGVFLIGTSLGAFAFLTERYQELQAVPGVDDPKRIASALYLGLWTLSVVVFALGVACVAARPPMDWRVRLLAIYGLGNFVAYSLIPYKTPWCLISFAWPFLFVGGVALSDLSDALVSLPTATKWRDPILALGALVLAGSTFLAVRLNYFRPTDVNEPYVYVQTFPDMWRITTPMLDLARKDPTAHDMTGIILCGSTYPLPWMLGDFTSIGYYNDDAHPPDFRADFVLAVKERVPEAEEHLSGDFFRESVTLRSAQSPMNLYFRASRFKSIFPHRQPEFHGQGVPMPPAVPDAPAAEDTAE